MGLRLQGWEFGLQERVLSLDRRAAGALRLHSGKLRLAPPVGASPQTSPPSFSFREGWTGLGPNTWPPVFPNWAGPSSWTQGQGVGARGWGRAQDLGKSGGAPGCLTHSSSGPLSWVEVPSAGAAGGARCRQEAPAQSSAGRTRKAGSERTRAGLEAGLRTWPAHKPVLNEGVRGTQGHTRPVDAVGRVGSGL